MSSHSKSDLPYIPSHRTWDLAILKPTLGLSHFEAHLHYVKTVFGLFLGPWSLLRPAIIAADIRLRSKISIVSQSGLSFFEPTSPHS